RSAAATDESTPPDIATTIRMSKNLPGPRKHERTKTHEDLLAHCTRASDLLRAVFVSSRLRGHGTDADAVFLVSPRSFSTSRGNISMTRSTSASVESIPRLKRSEFCVR